VPVDMTAKTMASQNRTTGVRIPNSVEIQASIRP
jgi:hypothetical protein